MFLYKDILDNIRSYLNFKPHVQELVTQAFNDVRAEFIEDEEKDVIFVGVHARRTDIAYHIKV